MCQSFNSISIQIQSNCCGLGTICNQNKTICESNIFSELCIFEFTDMLLNIYIYIDFFTVGMQYLVQCINNKIFSSTDPTINN